MYCSPIGHILTAYNSGDGKYHIARDCCCQTWPPNTWPPNEVSETDCTGCAETDWFGPDCLVGSVSGFAGSIPILRLVGTKYATGGHDGIPYVEEIDYCCLKHNIDLGLINADYYACRTTDGVGRCAWNSEEDALLFAKRSDGVVCSCNRPPEYQYICVREDPCHWPYLCCDWDIGWPGFGVWLSYDAIDSWSIHAQLLLAPSTSFIGELFLIHWKKTFNNNLCEHDWNANGFPMVLDELVYDQIESAFPPSGATYKPEWVNAACGFAGMDFGMDGVFYGDITGYSCGSITLSVPSKCPPVAYPQIYVPGWTRIQTQIDACIGTET